MTAQRCKLSDSTSTHNILGVMLTLSLKCIQVQMFDDNMAIFFSINNIQMIHFYCLYQYLKDLRKMCPNGSPIHL
jgi:hypothetical protein